MPIKGVTEILWLPRLGKIRLGVKEVSPKTGNPYPRAVEYFVCPLEVQKVFGERPKQLRIMLPTEDLNRFAQQWYKRYSSLRGLTCKGDGEACLMRLVDKKTGTFAHREAQDVEIQEGLPCPGEDCPEYQTKACRRVMNLMFLLPEVPGLGVWQIDSSSIYSILAINSGVELIRRAFKQVGRGMAMRELLLDLVPQEVAPDGKKKTVWVLRLGIAQTLAELMALPPVVEELALPYPKVPEPVGAEDLFPSDEENGQPAGPVVPPVPPVQAQPQAAEADPLFIIDGPGSSGWISFWNTMAEKEISAQKVYEALRVKSLKNDWMGKGRTLEEARQVIFKALGILPPEPKKLL